MERNLLMNTLMWSCLIEILDIGTYIAHDAAASHGGSACDPDTLAEHFPGNVHRSPWLVAHDRVF